VDEIHPSIIEINKIRTGNEKDEFAFKHINEDFADKQICKLSVKKTTGYDEISSKILKLAKPAVVKPITELINKSLDTSVFPAKLKIAQVVSVHKKNNKKKGNYRPVSVLPAVSNFFKRAVYIQIVEFFYNYFNIFLSAFRENYSCQETLIKTIGRLA